MSGPGNVNDAELEAEVVELAGAVLDGQASLEQCRKLNSLLLSRPEARQFYIDHVLLRALLVEAGGVAGADTPAPSAAPPAPAEEDADVLARAAADAGRPRRRVRARQRNSAFARAVARVAVPIGVAAAVVVWWQSGREAAVVVKPPAPVATLAAVIDARWGGTNFPAPGRRLNAGERLTLRAGLARVHFDGGATAVVEGPAAVTVSSAAGLSLSDGKVVVLAGEGTGGFVATMPHAVVTDLGTEFALRASGPADSDVFVLRGRVSLRPSAGSGTEAALLSAGEGRTARADGAVAALRPDAAGFVGPEQFDARVAAVARPLPRGWSDADVGSPRVAGGATCDRPTGAWLISGGGADLWGTRDQFHFAAADAARDVTLVARVVSLDDTGDHAKAGLMIRAADAADAPYAHVFVTPGTGQPFQGATFECRDAGGRPAQGTGILDGRTTPLWLRLERRGDTFSAWCSRDGAAWDRIGWSVAIPMPAARAGLVAAANNDTTTTTARFDNVRLEQEYGR